ncbi:MAG TPA: hypothetical protein VLT61_08240 [Anaeromyxobacteraceae bacterium]|nr:hypothetical protein [Anaeromyxobacteraceae bacterium]
MHLNPIPTEVTTGATDALLALLALAGARWIRGRPGVDPSRASSWSLVFALLGAASALGAVAHGLDLADALRALLWHPLYLLLGLVVAAFLAAAVHDLRGEAAARRARWPLLGTGAAFYVAAQLLGGRFIVFVAYEAVAMLSALAIYVALATRRRLPGAGVIAAGILLNLLAAAVQASTLSAHVLVPLDHNGLFHVVQAVAVIVLLAGVGARPKRALSPSGSP